MPKLKTETRKGLSGGQFALPRAKKYPIEDKRHAANAKARATQQYRKGKLSATDLATVRTKANKKLAGKK